MMMKNGVGVTSVVVGLLLVAILFTAGYLLVDINRFYHNCIADLEQTRIYADEAWKTMIENNGVSSRTDSIFRRTKKQVYEEEGYCDCSPQPDNCPAGPPGPPGTPGQPGEDGNPGRNGETGITEVPPASLENPYEEPCTICPVGPPGLPGPDGPIGLPGTDGENGLPGAPGNDGVTGAVGPTGDAGQPGANGEDGASGAPGKNGVQGTGEPGPVGPAGLAGPAGNNGVPGNAGSDGAPGTTGPVGMPGFIGQPGLDGEPGAPGIPGQPGYDAGYCPCPARGAMMEVLPSYFEPAPPAFPPPLSYVEGLSTGYSKKRVLRQRVARV